MTRSLNKALDLTEEIALIALLALIVALTFLDVVVRNLEIPLSSIQEFVPNLFVWATWLGVPYAIRKKEHFRVNVLPRALTDKAGNLLEWIGLGVGVCFFGLAGIYGAKVVLHDLRIGSTTQLGYSAAYLDSAIVVGSILATVRLVQGAFRRGDSRSNGETP